MMRGERKRDEGVGDMPVQLNAGRRRALRYAASGKRPDGIAIGSMEELRHLLRFVANDVMRDGEWILPIFQRLDDEVAARESRVSALDRVRQVMGSQQ